MFPDGLVCCPWVSPLAPVVSLSLVPEVVMQFFPPIPAWNALHPFVVHFPIVLLLLAPCFVLLSAILPPPKGRPYMTAALALLLLGTASLFLASGTGNAAAQMAQPGTADAAMAVHKDLASESELVFTVFSIILLGMAILPRVLCNEETRLTATFLPLSFLVLYCAGIVFVVNTANSGTLLVHQYGVHAIMPADSSQSNASSSAGPPAPTVGGN